MSERRILVSGASSGIGRSCAELFLHNGDRVTALSRSEIRLGALRNRLDPVAAKRLDPAIADVGDRQAMLRLAERVGAIDGIVAAAGVCRQSLLNQPQAEAIWSEVLRTNLDGVFYLLRYFAPLLRPGGRIVVVSSGLGKLGRAGYSAYAASKHAVLGLVKCAALELAERQITVNAVCPGWVETPMAQADLLDSARRTGRALESERADAVRQIPLGRFVQPGEVAELVQWLMSVGAGAITGQAFNISGGEFFA